MMRLRSAYNSGVKDADTRAAYSQYLRLWRNGELKAFKEKSLMVNEG